MTETEPTNQKSDFDSDLGLLSTYNSKHIDFPEWDASNPQKMDEQLGTLAKESFQVFISQLMEIKDKKDELREAKKLELQIHDFDKTQFHIDLPEPHTLFPRFHPQPRQKPLTRWEKFAKDRGIQKQKKRSKLVFDEVTQDWVYRYGSKGIKKIHEKLDVVREIKQQDNPYEDPWEKERIQKRLSKQKQELNEIKNKMRAKGQSIDEARTYDQKMQTIKQRKMKLKQLKFDKKRRLNQNLLIAQNSTASMGKFDNKAHNQEVHRNIKKRSVKSSAMGIKSEIERNKAFLKMITKRK